MTEEVSIGRWEVFPGLCQLDDVRESGSVGSTKNAQKEKPRTFPFPDSSTKLRDN